MRVAIIDADLISVRNHRFPNLACMKISAYWKMQGAEVELKLDYTNLEQYDLVSISKVFLDTVIPGESPWKFMKNERQIQEFYKTNRILNLPNVQYGGTGFFYDKAPALPDEIEHIMPDYHLYDNWVGSQLKRCVSRKELSYYLDWSIGFTTRGCIRKCQFCVNRNYNKCSLHSELDEFVDPDRPYICILDDNVFSCPEWKSIFDSLNQSGKRYQFKQGLDERLLTDEKCEYLFNKANWIGDRIFAFDNIKDKSIIIEKLKMIRRHTNTIVKFYVFCGFNHDEPGKYGTEFYRKDIHDLMERIRILMSYHCLPYIMRYKDYQKSPYKGFYNALSWWCNQPAFFKKTSFREFCESNQKRVDGECAAVQYLKKVENDFPDIAEEYFDMKWSDHNVTGD